MIPPDLLNRETKRIVLPDDGRPYTLGDVCRRLDELGVKYLVTGWWSFVLRDLTTEEPWVIWIFNDRYNHDEPLLYGKFVATLFRVPRELLTFGYERMMVYGYRARVSRISRALLDLAYIFGKLVKNPEDLGYVLAGYARCVRKRHAYRYIDRYPPYVKKAVDAAYKILEEIRHGRQHSRRIEPSNKLKP